MKTLKSKGLFITFEGNEGAGKSTLIEAVQRLCTQKGVPILVTREPGGATLAEGIRSLLLKEAMHPRTELLLYEAARAEHVELVIRPALKAGRVVLCDRYTDSSLAYQASGRGLDWKWVGTLNRWATDNLKPDFTVFLSISIKKGLRSATDHNRFEKEALQFHMKVRKGFARAIREDKKRFLVLEGHSASPEILAHKVWSRLDQLRSGKKRKASQHG